MTDDVTTVFELLLLHYPTRVVLTLKIQEGRSQTKIDQDSITGTIIIGTDRAGLDSLLHEYAHVMTFDQFGKKANRHGMEFFVNLLRLVQYVYIDKPDMYPWELEYKSVWNWAKMFKVTRKDWNRTGEAKKAR